MFELAYWFYRAGAEPILHDTSARGGTMRRLAHGRGVRIRRPYPITLHIRPKQRSFFA